MGADMNTRLCGFENVTGRKLKELKFQFWGTFSFKIIFNVSVTFWTANAIKPQVNWKSKAITTSRWNTVSILANNWWQKALWVNGGSNFNTRRLLLCRLRAHRPGGVVGSALPRQHRQPVMTWAELRAATAGDPSTFPRRRNRTGGGWRRRPAFRICDAVSWL